MTTNANQVGEIVLESAINQAKKEFGSRLLACYALGSLAHGGFSPQVSDIDLAIILTSPLVPRDCHQIELIKNFVKSLQIPLAERLSIFWGSLASLKNQEPGGRFPPIDKLDLIEHGRLLTGYELGKHLTKPTRRELEVFGAHFALNFLGKPEISSDLFQPANIFDKGVMHFTKIVLFPVRFLYTAYTGKIGLNDMAVAYYLKNNQGRTVELVELAFHWRYELPTYNEHAINLVKCALIPLYIQFIHKYHAQMLSYKEINLVKNLEQWRSKLSSHIQLGDNPVLSLSENNNRSQILRL